MFRQGSVCTGRLPSVGRCSAGTTGRRSSAPSFVVAAARRGGRGRRRRRCGAWPGPLMAAARARRRRRGAAALAPSVAATPPTPSPRRRAARRASGPLRTVRRRRLALHLLRDELWELEFSEARSRSSSALEALVERGVGLHDHQIAVTLTTVVSKSVLSVVRPPEPMVFVFMFRRRSARTGHDSSTWEQPW